MSKIRLIVLLYSMLHFGGFAQNIIPNPSFEALSSYLCAPDPIAGFRSVEDWYSYGTPHLWFDGCLYDEDVWNFWDPSATLAHGLSSIGLTGVLLVNGEYSSVAMAANLIQPMLAGQEYYLQFKTRNRGVWHQTPDSLRICDTDPPKSIHFSFGDQNLLEPATFYQQTPDINLTSPVLQFPEKSDWIKLTQCFEAPSNASTIGLSLSRGLTNMNPPCEVRALGQGPNYFIFHFDFDDLILYPVPEKLDTTFRSCGGKAFEIDLIDFSKIPPRVEVTFDWSDGVSGAARSLSQTGLYTVEAKLDCTSFPIEIIVEEEDCSSKSFVPNAFSPNGDGVNDEFRPLIKSDYPIQNYSLMVFDRWGAKLFESNDPAIGWTGATRGKPLSAGVFMWTLQFEVAAQEVLSVKKGGEVLLIH